MKLIINSFLALGLATASTHAFVPNALTISPAAIASKNGISRPMVASTLVEDGPPTDTAEKYGTTVGDTKGAALRLDGVAISRGASPLLKNINWSVQPKERWGIVGVNGAGKSTLLGAITGTVRMDEGHAFVHANARVGYLKQSVSIMMCG
jgi:ABC-type transport system involved in cytochrome bd biosynthesis fused ATPase/permease subunit